MSSIQGEGRSAVVKALEQPEILDLVARSMPLFSWSETYQGSLEGFLEFQPWVYLSCIRVSRLWHQAFMPHLWHYYFNYHMDPTLPGNTVMDRAVLLKHFLLARRHMYASVSSDNEPIFTSEDEEKRAKEVVAAPTTDNRNENPLRLPMPKHLWGLFVYMTPTEMMTRLLVANAHQLRELHLEGGVQIPTAVLPEVALQSIKSMPYLQELSLANWHLQSNDLTQILRGCQDTLQILKVRSVAGFEIPSRPSHLLSSVSENHHRPQAVDPWAGVYLPRVKELTLLLDWTESKTAVFLPRLCPNLESVKLEVDTGSDLTGLIQTLREYCPNMKALQYQEGYSMENETGYYPEPEVYRSLIEDCARPLDQQGDLEQQERGQGAAMAAMSATMSSIAMEEPKMDIGRDRMERTSTLCSLDISAENGLDEAFTDSILVHAATLEKLSVRLHRLGEVSVFGRQIQRIMQSCPRLKVVGFNEPPNQWDWKRIYSLFLISSVTTATTTATTPQTDITAEWVCKGLQRFTMEELQGETQDELNSVDTAEWDKFEELVAPWQVEEECKISQPTDLHQLFLLIQSRSDSLRRVSLGRTLFTR